jgi:endonuclease/exonuclease/phosphatase (EEP) superfamily protein YafD
MSELSRRGARVLAHGALIVCGATAVLGTRVPWWPWPIELLVHWPELWMGCLLFFCGRAAVRREPLRALLCVALLAAGALRLAPYMGLPSAPPTSTEGRSSVRLLVANLWCEREPTPAFAALLEREQPDLLAVIELTPAWHAELERFRERWPHRLVQVRDDPFGLALYSRWPLEELHLGPLGAEGYAFALARVRHPAGELSCAVAHPRAPQHPRGWYGRNDYLGAVAEMLRAAPAPRVLAIDSNATPWSGEMRSLVSRTGLLDARAGRGWCGTWPTFLPSLCLRPIDHLLHEPAIAIDAFRVTEPYGSDHRGLAVELRLPH